MAKQKVDIKQFMLEKGERLGMGIAAGIMLLLLAVGAYAGLTRESPSETVSKITSDAGTIEQKLQSGEALSPPGVDKSILVQMDGRFIDPEGFRTKVDLVGDEGVGDKKRRNPTVELPVEFQAEAVQAATRDLMLAASGKDMKIGILRPKESKGKPPETDPRTKALKDWADNVKRQGGYLSPAVYEQLAKMSQNAEGTQEKFTLEFVDLAKGKDAKLAETVHANRLVVIYASFPYKKQLANFSRALNADEATLINTKELPAFEPCEVRRRAIDAKGTPLKGDDGKWKAVKMDENYDIIYRRMRDSQPEDAKLNPVTFNGQPSNILMQLPLLARGEYPMMDLKTVRQTAEALTKKGGTELKVLSPRDVVKGIHAPVTTPTGTTTEVKAGDKYEVPEHCLVRLVDADPALRPGMTYQYQIKMRMRNPNAGKKPPEVATFEMGAKEILEADAWSPPEADLKSMTVTMQRELFVYATEPDPMVIREKANRYDTKLLNDRDVAWLQAHQWMETIPVASGVNAPLGDYVIGDIAVRRGEYVSRLDPAPVAVWYPTREIWDFASPPRASKLQKLPLNPGDKQDTWVPVIPVYFGAKDPKQLDLLVDFEGGSGSIGLVRTGDKPRVVTENAGLEVLLMAPDGSLRVQSSKLDARDKDKDKRLTDWKKTMEEVRTGKKPKGGIEIK